MCVKLLRTAHWVLCNYLLPFLPVFHASGIPVIIKFLESSAVWGSGLCLDAERGWNSFSPQNHWHCGMLADVENTTSPVLAADTA
ncbi:hypothetical protein BaRGS_00023919, partial [Batillaria attramentaria]